MPLPQTVGIRVYAIVRHNQFKILKRSIYYGEKTVVIYPVQDPIDILKNHQNTT